jgi:radical SAM enzyme (TIGR01210 family)
VKLYNAGNFFDPQAIPPEDYAEIARRLDRFETVIVENHPRLTDDRCLRFRDFLTARLEVALGLETVHPTVLASLNKRMTVQDYDTAARFLKDHDIDLRTFLLVKPPGLSEQKGIDWALRSLEHAVHVGADCVSFIPTRAGNGLMEHLQAEGLFSPPSIRSLERVFERGLEYVQRVGRGTRVFMDVWNAELFFDCAVCGPQRAGRIQRMNQSQKDEPAIGCACHRTST